jgi:chromosome segregation ATPase
MRLADVRARSNQTFQSGALMTDTMLLECDAVLGTFRQWRAELDPIDSQLSESLSALAAYQSHLDDWQRQLAKERDELQANREQWDRERGDSVDGQYRLNELTAELRAARDEIAVLTGRLECGEEELRAERERFEREITAAAEKFNSDTTSLVDAELNAARDEIANLTAALNSRFDELQALREEHEQGRSAGEAVQAQLAEVTEELSAARKEIVSLSESLSAHEEDLRAERQKIEDNESSAEQHEARLAEATDELNAARDKIAELSSMLLSRAEELRTLDVRRAEASTELELARTRERELKAELEELSLAREREQAEWSEESRQLREMVERRLEAANPADGAARPGNSLDEERVETKPAERVVENAVFASVKEQFGKLRQQRAMDRPASKKAR